LLLLLSPLRLLRPLLLLLLLPEPVFEVLFGEKEPFSAGFLVLSLVLAIAATAAGAHRGWQLLCTASNNRCPTSLRAGCGRRAGSRVKRLIVDREDASCLVVAGAAPLARRAAPVAPVVVFPRSAAVTAGAAAGVGAGVGAGACTCKRTRARRT